MNETSLLAVCVTAFSAVFFLLALLAGIMRLISFVFPVREGEAAAASGADPAVIAAITAVASRAFPGAKITHIKEMV